jgi:hypothetical protein
MLTVRDHHQRVVGLDEAAVPRAPLVEGDDIVRFADTMRDFHIQGKRWLGRTQ